MIQTLATVIRNEVIAPGYGRAALACGEGFARARPGQFVMLGFPEAIDPLLRRPFSIHRLVAGGSAGPGIEVLYKVVGHATRRLSRVAPGEPLSLLGPLGRGFQVPSGVKRLFCVAGGFGVAPFVFLAEWLQGRPSAPAAIELFLGGRGREDLLCTADFERLGIPVHLTTDDGSCGDQCRVTDPFAAALARERPDLVLACGPRAMLACVLGIVRAQRIACQLSIEAMMACGMGACLGCAVEGRRDPSRFLHACVDGPVFDAEEIDLE
ncbi:MAG: dihydroorotate dehydrogenase electron transfer subunit [Desulfobacterales bacterium]|jgi:dihydroorotate dehydrogenase electron transfer subunit|nr:dihydroorotate dehydrogenase electron transfer subunit [Desulfobacterales bacterium]